ncbi:ABC transporter permease [Sorangium sp. So ce1389]|uniref:ABC transporter permease n=1 Tax=Sorangium sp. So ce1389 TaxID=3133336 RepID=UPI003F634C6C
MTEPLAVSAQTDTSSDSTRDQVLQLLVRMRTFIALILVVVFFSVMAPNFVALDNAVIICRHVAVYALIAIGMTFVIVTGGIDLSVGSIVGLSGMVAGFLITHGIRVEFLKLTIYPSVPVVLGLSILVGVGIGALNGLLVARLNVAPFIATLGTMFIARGAAMLLSGGETFPNLVGRPGHGNEGYPILGSGTVLRIPLSILLLVLVALVAAYLATRTPLGRQIYAVGGNERAAALSGVYVGRVKIVVFVISGGLSALAGLIVSSQLVASHPAAGDTFEMNAIAAAVLGGTSLAGGRGTIGGTIVGAFVIGVLSDGLVMMGVSQFWQMVIKGVVIIAAVVLDQMQRKMTRRA